jgi:hypothetical protein
MVADMLNQASDGRHFRDESTLSCKIGDPGVINTKTTSLESNDPGPQTTLQHVEQEAATRRRERGDPAYGASK